MSEEVGASAALRLIREALDKHDYRLLLTAARILADGVFATIADSKTVMLPRVVEGYKNLVSEVANVVAEASKLLGLGEVKAEILRGIARGEYIASQHCTPVIVLSSFEVEGVLYRRGELACVGIEQALRYHEAGLVKLVESGLRKLFYS